MRNFIIILFFLGGTLMYSQEIQDNRFREKPAEEQSDIAGGPGDNDGDGDLEGNDPVPAAIDDYIPILLISALGFIIYQGYRQKGQFDNK